MNLVQKAFWIFALTTILWLIADRLLFVLFPIYLIQKQFTATEIGLIFSVAALFLVLLRTFIGRLSDRYGRKGIMSLGLLFESIAISFYPIISRFYQFAVVKSVQEMGTTLKRSISYSLQADSFPSNVRAKYMAKLGTVMPLGRTIAMVIGFLVVTYFSLATGFYFAAFFIFASFLIFTLFYKEDRIKRRFEPKLWKYPSRFRLVVFGGFVQELCYAMSYFPAFFILANIYLKISTDLLFLILLVDYSICIPIVHYLGKRVDRFGRMRSMLFGFAFMGIFTALYAFASGIVQFLIVLIGLSLSFFIWRIAFKTVVMDFAEPKARGEQLGFSETVIGIGDLIGPIIGGLLIDLFAIQVPFLVSGLLYFLMAIILFKQFRC